MLSVIRNKIKESLCVFFWIFSCLPLKNNKIMFNNFNGNGYGDSCKYIEECLSTSEIKYKMIWTVKKHFDDMPSHILQVRYLSLRWFFHMSTSKIWISNTRFASFVRKRKKQIYIQTWHGGIAFKKIEYDAESLDSKYLSNMKNDTNITDYMISNSEFCSSMYRRAFKYYGEIMEYGTPRNDCLITKREALSKKARKIFNINDEDKVLLYAPTFRDNYEHNPYDIDFQVLKSELEKRTNSKWIMIVKLHPRFLNSGEKFFWRDDIINATNYPDIQEIICASDILITDYSSTMFEAMIAEKPVIIYANDIDNYGMERGYYFHFNELPFPLATNNKELIRIIELSDFLEIKEKYKKFEEKIGLLEDGHASEKVCKLIEKKIIEEL